MMKHERATKKQQELLQFVADFIKEHDYGPSYREIMRALDYKSVSTVAVHVDGLIAKGYLNRRDHTARSLEVVTASSTDTSQPTAAKNELYETALKWSKSYAASQEPNRDDIETLIKALDLLGYNQEAAEVRKVLDAGTDTSLA